MKDRRAARNRLAIKNCFSNTDSDDSDGSYSDNSMEERSKDKRAEVDGTG